MYGGEENEMKDNKSGEKRKSEKKKGSADKQEVMVKGRRWHWNEGKMCWKEGDEKDGVEGGAEGGNRVPRRE